MIEQTKSALAIILLATLLASCGAGEPPASEAAVTVESPSLNADYRNVEITALQTADQLNAACETEAEALKAGIVTLEKVGDGTSPGD